MSTVTGASTKDSSTSRTTSYVDNAAHSIFNITPAFNGSNDNTSTSTKFSSTYVTSCKSTVNVSTRVTSKFIHFSSVVSTIVAAST